MKQCHRGHTGHMIKIVVIGKDGNLKEKSFCDYIVGTTGVESSNFKAIFCGNVPKGEKFPTGMRAIGEII